jgi:hypothetical protein
MSFAIFSRKWNEMKIKELTELKHKPIPKAIAA